MIITFVISSCIALLTLFSKPLTGGQMTLGKWLSLCLGLGQLQRAIEIRVPCGNYRSFRWHSIAGLLIPWPNPTFLTSLWGIFQNGSQILLDAALCLRAGFPDGEGQQEWLSEVISWWLTGIIKKKCKTPSQKRVWEFRAQKGEQGSQSEWSAGREPRQG